jgi:hypothetical protein
MNQPAIVKVIKEIPQDRLRGQAQVGELVEAIDKRPDAHGQLNVFVKNTSGKMLGWLRSDEYELISGEIPIQDNSPVKSGAYPRNPQQIRMNKAASRHAKRARGGHTQQY